MLISVTNWQLSFLYQLRRFQNRNFWYTFQTLFARKWVLAHPYVLYENELFLIWHEINDNVFSPWGPVFRDFVRKKKKNLDVLRIFDNPLSKYLTTQFSLLRRLNFGQLLKLNRGLGLVTGAYFQNIFIWTCPLDNTSSIDRVWFFFTTIMGVF